MKADEHRSEEARLCSCCLIGVDRCSSAADSLFGSFPRSVFGASLLGDVPVFAAKQALHHRKQCAGLSGLLFIQQLVDLGERTQFDSGHLGLQRSFAVDHSLQIVTGLAALDRVSDRQLALQQLLVDRRRFLLGFIEDRLDLFLLLLIQLESLGDLIHAGCGSRDGHSALTAHVVTAAHAAATAHVVSTTAAHRTAAAALCKNQSAYKKNGHQKFVQHDRSPIACPFRARRAVRRRAGPTLPPSIHTPALLWPADWVSGTRKSWRMFWFRCP